MRMNRVRSRISDSDAPGGSWAESLFTAPLANVGLAPSCENPRDCGVFFMGDGEVSEGWYHAWSLDRDLVVAGCSNEFHSHSISPTTSRSAMKRQEFSRLLRS